MRLYRLILAILGPILIAMALWRRLRGTETARSLTERLGGGLESTGPESTGPGSLAPERVGGADPAGPVLWLHAASNGELTSARALMIAALERRQDLRILVTCNTETGRALVEGWEAPRIRAALAPIDMRWIVARFLRRHRPAALLIVENEIWPNRMDLTRRRSLPAMMAGARLSASSARMWRRVPRLAAQVFGALDHVSAQDPDSAERFVALGLPRERLGPLLDLKAATTAVPEDRSALPGPLRRAFDPARTLLAASTHEGEEALVLDAFARARSAGVLDRLILAPRHPRRGDAVAAAVTAQGLACARRSAGEAPGEGPQAPPVYLADTMGEMDLWYRLAGLCFVGGSLVARGGHTPFEPAAHGAAILHGPHTENFAAIYARLDAAGAACPVADGAALATALIRLATPSEARAMAASAAATIAGSARGDMAPLLDTLDRLLERAAPAGGAAMPAADRPDQPA